MEAKRVGAAAFAAAVAIVVVACGGSSSTGGGGGGGDDDGSAPGDGASADGRGDGAQSGGEGGNGGEAGEGTEGGTTYTCGQRDDAGESRFGTCPDGQICCASGAADGPYYCSAGPKCLGV